MLHHIDARSYQGLQQLLAVQLPNIRSSNASSTSSSPTSGGFRLYRPQNQCIETHQCFTPEQESEISSMSLDESEGSSGRAQTSSGVVRRGRKGPYRKYTTEQKERAIIEINKGRDVKTVSKECAIPRRNLLRWKKNGCQRKEGGGRPSDFEMEENLFKLILSGDIKTEAQIREYALNHTNFQKFKASKGWFTKFKRRLGVYRQKAAGTGGPFMSLLSLSGSSSKDSEN